MNTIEELDQEFKDDPDYQQLSHEEKRRIISVMEKMMDMGMAAIYGDESEDQPESRFPCHKYISQCKAKCCTFIFALTHEEVDKGIIAWNKDKPYFIARDKEDGYCPHLNRDTWQCNEWENRPLRCRRYDCRDDNIIEIDPADLVLADSVGG